MMPYMRTTLRIPDDLLRDIKELAAREKTSMTCLVASLLRLGVRTLHTGQQRQEPYREHTHDLGEPRLDVDKSLQIASALEDEEVLHKLSLRK